MLDTPSLAPARPSLRRFGPSRAATSDPCRVRLRAGCQEAL
jgi:hypothetical protein